MKAVNLSLRVIIGLATAVTFTFFPSAQAQTQTAQSVMVSTTLGSNAYELQGTISWTFDRDTAETYYSNTLDPTAPVVVNTGTGATQTSPGAPDPDAHKLMQKAQADRCIFFNGGTLTSESYTQKVTGTRGWSWTYTYKITPTMSVPQYTAWTSESTGGTVNIDYSGFISSESFQKQSNRTKYSFTLGTPGPDTTLSRVQNVSIKLQAGGVSGWSDVATNLDGQALPVSITTADYVYLGNAGAYGNAAVYNFLHTTAPGKQVVGILAEDNFANNNNDLSTGNVHQANYSGTFGISEPGSYQILVGGTIKNNAAEKAQGFSVGSDIIVVGGCQVP